jgi:FkbM family methyltransferase
MTPLITLLKDLELTVTGLVHIGANNGEEFPIYRDGGITLALYVEPLADIFQDLTENLDNTPGHFPIQALCSDLDDIEVQFHVSSNSGSSSSMLPLGWHVDEHPEVEYVETLTLKTTTLDTLLDRFVATHSGIARDGFDCLVLDTQGTELRILQGAHRSLSHLKYLYLEVNEGGLYQGDCSLDDLIGYLRVYGFRLKNLAINKHRWGDALFVKNGPAA